MHLVNLAVLFAWSAYSAGFDPVSVKRITGTPGYSRHLISKSGNCAVVLAIPRREHDRNPFKERKLLSAAVSWIASDAKPIGSMRVNQRTEIEAVSDRCERTVLINFGYDPAELGSGGYDDPEWERTGIRDTGTLKRNPELKDSFIIVADSRGHHISTFRMPTFAKAGISPNGEWVFYGENTTDQTTIHIVHLVSGASSKVENAWIGGSSIDNSGKLINAEPSMLNPRRRE